MPDTPQPLHRKHRLPRVAFALALAVALATIGAAAAAPTAPVLNGPGPGASTSTLPVFSWQPVASADHYEFEFSADSGFNSSLTLQSTRNTRATLRDAIPNGDYYWRVRAVTASGELGAWSETRSLDLAWTARPSLLTPAHGASITYPLDMFKLAWTPVDGATEYLVKLATDPALGSIVWSSGPVRTAATSFTLSAPLAPGTYYWSITPLDGEGHAGNPSPVASFTWSWPSATTPAFTDLAAAVEIVDPFFSWTRVPGAAGYEVEVNSSSDWAGGSKVCCDPLRLSSDISTIGLSLAPRVQLDNNTYYWRVRAIDPSGNAGIWNVGPSFTQTFATVPPTPAPSVKNLRMRDNMADPHDGADPLGITFPITTATPIISWNPVPGASGYQVDVTRWVEDGAGGGACNWSYSASEHWVKVTSSTSWTPLGWGWNSVKPYPDPNPVSTDGSTGLVAGHRYCARVRPLDRASEITGPLVFGDWTYLGGNNVPAFEWSGPPSAGPCSPCSLPSGHYRLPASGSTSVRMPLFTWQPIPGAQTYYVLVSRDPNFTNIVDYAFTRIPAYAPRTGSQSKGYADELTSYYWAVLPATGTNGSGVSAHPLGGTPPAFHKQATPPTRIEPAPGAVLNGPTTFRWTPVEAARHYTIEVAQDPSFANPIDSEVTDSTAYTSTKTYPADTILYWRVRANAEDGNSDVVGLTWSSAGTFQKQLPAPVPDAANPTTGNFLPTLAWSPVPGAVSYDVHGEEPDGDQRDFTNLPSHAFTPSLMTGIGIFKIQARANFPSANGSVVHGPYSPLMSFARTIPEPAGAATDAGPSHIALSWQPRMGAKSYRVQISTRPDFGSFVENTTTQAPNYAPFLTQRDYVDGGRLYWRVAAVDIGRNVGDFTPVQEFGIAQTLRLRTFGSAIKGRRTTVNVTVSSARGATAGARVRVWGAGMRSRAKLTTAEGRASFVIRPTRRGRVFVQVTKAEFVGAQASITVRVPRRR